MDTFCVRANWEKSDNIVTGRDVAGVAAPDIIVNSVQWIILAAHDTRALTHLSKEPCNVWQWHKEEGLNSGSAHTCKSFIMRRMACMRMIFREIIKCSLARFYFFFFPSHSLPRNNKCSSMVSAWPVVYSVHMWYWCFRCWNHVCRAYVCVCVLNVSCVYRLFWNVGKEYLGLYDSSRSSNIITQVDESFQKS